MPPRRPLRVLRGHEVFLIRRLDLQSLSLPQKHRQKNNMTLFFVFLVPYATLSACVFVIFKSIDRKRQALIAEPAIGLDFGWLVPAMVLGPLLFTALTGILAVPVIGLAFGILPYVVFGIPVMSLVLLRFCGRPLVFVGASVVTNLALLQAQRYVGDILPFVLPPAEMFTFQIGFGVAWSASSGWLYQRWSHRKTLDQVF